MSDLAQPELTAQFLATIAREGLLPAGSRVLCALSGGPDSVALLHMLCAAGAERGWEVRAGHVDHALRDDSPSDADFCRQLCQDWDVPFHEHRVDWEARGGTPATNREARAREERYRCLREWAQEWAAGAGATSAVKIVVGHHADDRAETLLGQLIRGAGPRGLSHPRFERADGIVRPMLDCTRAQVRAYLDDQNLLFREDPTNKDGSNRRSRLRRDVIPALERENPEAIRAMTRAGRALALTADFLEAEAARAAEHLGIPGTPGEFLLDGGNAQPYHPIVLSTLLWNAVRHRGGEVEFEPLEQAAKAWISGGSYQVDLPGAVRIAIHEFRAAVLRTDEPPVPPVERSVPVPGRICWAEGEPETGRGPLHLNVVTAEPPKDPGRDSGPDRAWIDADRVVGELTVRNRRPGDRYQPLGLEGSVKLQDLFVDRKVPRRWRDHVPIVADERGILWIPGFRVDHRGRITDNTVKALRLELSGEMPHLGDPQE